MEPDQTHHADTSIPRRGRKLLCHVLAACGLGLAVNLPAGAELQLERLGDYRTGIFDESAAFQVCGTKIPSRLDRGKCST